MRFIAPFARVTIVQTPEPNYVFESGDGFLMSCFVELSETDRSSHCGFTLNDPGLRLAAKFFEISFLKGGIKTPADLLKANQAIESNLDSYRPQVSTSNVDASQAPEIRAWLDTIAYAEGTAGADGYRTMYGGGLFQGYKDHPRKIICSGGICSDASGRGQFLSTTWDSLGLPDFSPPNQDKGMVKLIERRGSLQDALKGEAGFDAVLQKISYEWASLPPYRYKGQGQYSRDLLFEVYRQNLAKFKQSGSTPTPQQSSNLVPTQLIDKDDQKLIELSSKGTEIIIEMGYGGALTEFHYFHTGTEASGRSPDTTTFQGQCVRWLMTRRKKNTAYTNVSLKQLATKVAKAYGLKLDMEGDGPTYSFLSQDGISDYELLLRECRAIGYSITDTKDVLILRPLRANFTGFVITRDMLIDKGALRFTDKASSDRIPLSALTNNPAQATAADPKMKLDRLSGQPVQVQAENSAAAGKTGVQVTGGATKAIAGTPAPQSTKVSPILGSISLNTIGSVLTSIATGTPIQTATTPAANTATTPTNEQTPVVTDPVSTVKAGEVLPTSLTGLPKQEIGAISLAGDGRAEAQRLVSEQKRVKGYESSARLIMSPESLTLAPGSIIAISDQVVPPPFAREWRIATARHTIQSGKASTEIHFYSPQAANTTGLEDVQTSAVDNTAGAASNAPLKPGGFILPLDVKHGVGDGLGPRGGGRYHHGVDFPGDKGQPMWAAGDGRVVDVQTGCQVGDFSCGGGYGNLVFIDHAGGIQTRYCHLTAVSVQIGQMVKQRQVVGTMGDTGHSYGDHLHFEIAKGGSKIPPSQIGIVVPGGRTARFQY